MDLLSICIPTYNRKERLHNLLKSLQQKNKEKFKIIVSDNGSTDGTYEMVQEFIDRGEIIYFRNERNLGIDENYACILKYGKEYSMYSLWIGDDDMPLPAFFEDIPKLLCEKKPNLLALNSVDNRNGFLAMELDQDCVKHDLMEAFESWSFDGIGWMGAVVDNSRLNLVKSMKYYGTMHLATGAIAEMLSDVYKEDKKITVYKTAKPYILTNIGKKEGYAFRDIYRAGYWGIGKLFAAYPIEFRKSVVLRLKMAILFGLPWADEAWESYVNMLLAIGARVNEGRPVCVENLYQENDYFYRAFLTYDKGINFVILGTGVYGIKCLKLFGNQKRRIAFFVDNDKKKQGKNIAGIPVKSPEILKDIKNPRIIIAVTKEKRNGIPKQLQNMGFISDRDFITIEAFGRELFRRQS